MTDKGMFILQDCTLPWKDVPGSCIDMSPTSSYDAFQTICIKVEEISDIEVEEDPLPISVSGLEADQAVSCFMSSLSDSRASTAACFRRAPPTLRA
jgi:hypothetical protein